MRARDGQIIDYRVLDRRILVVAKEKIPNEWVVYIGVVAGVSHGREIQGVIDYGSVIDGVLARFLFPGFGKGRVYTY
jgi:hypothetical protein